MIGVLLYTTYKDADPDEKVATRICLAGDMFLETFAS